eukprot:4070176-Prorocentrum_lima.AAC.1
MNEEEKESWIEAIKAELESFKEMEVFDETTYQEMKNMKVNGGEVKRLPARLILVKKPSAQDHNGS